MANDLARRIERLEDAAQQSNPETEARREETYRLVHELFLLDPTAEDRMIAAMQRERRRGEPMTLGAQEQTYRLVHELFAPNPAAER